MPQLYIEFDPALDGAPALSVDTSEIVWFLSWAFAGMRYGASHELSLTAIALRKEHGIDLTPLLTFADREIEDLDDAEELERVWQDGGPLAACCEAVVAALDTPAGFTDVLAEYTNLRPALAGLAANARWAAERGARIRVTYTLEKDL